MQNPGMERDDCMFIEKNLHVSGTVQFNLVLFKGQLYCKSASGLSPEGPEADDLGNEAQ